MVFACDDPDALARFWAEALGYIMQPPPEGFDTWDAFADSVNIPEDRRNDLSAIVDPAGVGPRILFERWQPDEPQKRIHIDINALRRDISGEERLAALRRERERLEGLGATFHRRASGMAGEEWIEMFDPEGNWFCVQ